MRADALSKMSHLKLLILRDVNFSGSLNYLSNELGYLCWDNYPFTCLPSSFQPDKLVELKLRNSSIKQLWEGIKSLHNLRGMNLSHSRNLIKMPDFGQFPNLERLKLEGCIKLVQINPSIGILRKLAHLNLKNCKNLVSIPNNIFHLRSLEYLSLYGCSKLFNNQLLEKPRHAEHLEKFDINGRSPGKCQSTFSISKILMLPLRVFCSRRHEDSVGLLLPSLPRFPCLQHLDLSFCNLLQIPDAIGGLHCLESLELGGNNFVTLPSTIKELSKLLVLNLEHCKQLKYLPELPSTVPIYGETRFHGYDARLNIFDCPNLREMENCYNMAFSWMIQVLKVHMQSSFPFGEIHIVIRGSGIPKWFNNQNVGSSISMDPSPNLHDKNWIGVAFCAAFVAHDAPTYLGDRRRPHYSHNLGFSFIIKETGFYTVIHFEKDLVTVESDHLILLYLTREPFNDSYVNYLSQGSHDLDGIKLAATTHHPPPGFHVEVKNCGYRWVYEEDLEQLNTSMMRGRNSSVGKCKFLTMDSSNSI